MYNNGQMSSHNLTKVMLYEKKSGKSFHLESFQHGLYLSLKIVSKVIVIICLAVLWYIKKKTLSFNPTFDKQDKLLYGSGRNGILQD